MSNNRTRTFGPGDYIRLRSDWNTKNTINQVNGVYVLQKWIENSQVVSSDPIRTEVETIPRVAGGWGTGKNVFGVLLDFVRGENYYCQNHVILKATKPIDFSSLRCQVSHTSQVYQETGDTAYDKMNNLSPGIGEDVVGILGGVESSNQGETFDMTRRPVCQFPQPDDASTADIPRFIGYSWSASPTEGSGVPRQEIGYGAYADSGGGGNTYPKWAWSETRFRNTLISSSFGATYEAGDEFYGFRKVDKSGNVVDWNNPGENWDPYAVRVDYLIRAETRKYLAKRGAFGGSKTGEAQRVVSQTHVISLIATQLDYEEVPFTIGSSDNQFEYPKTDFLSSLARYSSEDSEFDLYSLNSKNIIKAYQNGLRVVELEIKVLGEFVKVGDYIKVKNGKGDFIMKGSDPMKFVVVSARCTCKSTYNQTIIAIEATGSLQ